MITLSDKIQANIINKDKHLDLSKYKLTGNEDELALLQQATHLTVLYLSDNWLHDISFLSNLTQLTTLHLSFNQIADFSILSGLTQLTKLDLYNNQIADFSAISNLTQLTKLGVDIQNLSFPPYWYAYLKENMQMSKSSYISKQLTAIEKIWQIMKNGNEENIELAKQIALGQGWTKEEFDMYKRLI